MAVDRVVSCDVCGVCIIRLLDSESIEDEVVGTGGCPASIHPEDLDVCAECLVRDNAGIRAVRKYTGEMAPAPVA